MQNRGELEQHFSHQVRGPLHDINEEDFQEAPGGAARPGVQEALEGPLGALANP
jgi:hypothetical protein